MPIPIRRATATRALNDKPHSIRKAATSTVEITDVIAIKNAPRTLTGTMMADRKTTTADTTRAIQK